jgi:hypothetical protein
VYSSVITDGIHQNKTRLEFIKGVYSPPKHKRSIANYHRNKAFTRIFSYSNIQTIIYTKDLADTHNDQYNVLLDEFIGDSPKIIASI